MTNEQEKPRKIDTYQTTAASCNHLMGKVVLLIGNDTAVLQTLITQLAQKGADIALVYWQLPMETVCALRESVESLGRRFLFIHEAKCQIMSTNHLVQTAVTQLGNVDVFIDLSAQKTELAKNKNGMGQRISNWHFAQAAIKALVQA